VQRQHAFAIGEATHHRVDVSHRVLRQVALQRRERPRIGFDRKHAA
jgi:hypothetical protein